MDTIIVVDFGTSAVKSFLYRLDTGVIIGASEVETQYFTPELGAAETNSEFWWDGLCQTINDLITKYNPVSLKGVTITNQQISCVFLDEEQKPLSPAILWMDTRCTEEVNLLKKEALHGSHESFSAWALKKTGIPPSDEWGLAKILWYKASNPENFKRLKQVASVDAFILQRLTGKFVTDETNACFFHLDISNKQEAHSLLDILDLKADLFPEVIPPGSYVGKITDKAAAQTGLPKQLPVIMAGSDQPCAILGMGVNKPGEAVVNLGSGSFLMTPLENFFTDSRLMTNISTVQNQWLLMGTHYLTGSAFRWLRDIYDQNKSISYADLDQSASKIEAGSDGLVFLPSLSGSGTPFWDSEAKGIFAGLSLQHKIGHLARAIMESTGYGIKNILEVLTECQVNVSRIVIAGGATISSVWKHSIADILGVDVEISASKEATSLGAAILAGVSLGRFSSIEAGIHEWVEPGEVIQPNSNNRAVYEKAYQMYLAWRDAEYTIRKASYK